MPNSLFPDNTFPDSKEFPFSIDYGKFGNVIFDDNLSKYYNHFSLSADFKLDKDIKYNSKIENIRPPEKIYKPSYKRFSKDASENKIQQTNYFLNCYGNEYVPDKLIESNIQKESHDLYQGNVFQHFSLTKNQDYILFPSNEISSDLSIIPISRKYVNSLNTSLNLNKTTVVPFSSPIKQLTKPHIINDDEFLLSVRHQSKINFVKCCQNKSSFDTTDTEESSENKNETNNNNSYLNPDLKYQIIQELNLTMDQQFRHVTQNSYIPNEFLILENDNSIKLYNLELDELNTVYSKDKKNTYLFNRCDYLNHPKLVSYINSSKLRLLDLRRKTKSSTIYSLEKDQYTACSPHPTILNHIVASTNNYLMLYDIRYTKKAMLRWNHHQNQYYPTEISIIPLSQNYTDFSSDIILTWNQYNIISGYCYDPINVKQNDNDTTIMPPVLSNIGTHIDSFPMEDKPLRLLEINENNSLSKNSSIFYPQKSYLKGLDYAVFMLDTKETNLKKEIAHTDQIGIKIYQYSDDEEIFYSTISFSQSSKKKVYRGNEEVLVKIEEAVHHPSSLPKPKLNPKSKKYNKLKNKLRKKLISTLDRMKVSQSIKSKVLRRFEKINNVYYFDINELNHKKLKKYGKFVVIKPRHLKDKSSKDIEPEYPEYSIVSHSRYQIHPTVQYFNEMKSFNIIDLSSVYRYMVYETRMALKSDTIHGHISMTKKKIMKYIEDLASLVECNQKIKSLYEIHKRLSDIPIEYNNRGLPFFLPTHHLSINLDWTNKHFLQSFLSYMKKIYPNTHISSHLLYISPRPDSLIDLSDFASVFENLDRILPSPVHTTDREAMISNKQVMAHSLVLAKVAYDLWSSSHVCDICFKPSSKNKRNIHSSYEAYTVKDKNNTVNTSHQDTPKSNSLQDHVNDTGISNANVNGNPEENTRGNSTTTTTTGKESSQTNDTNPAKDAKDKKSSWLREQIERFKTLNSKSQSVFLPVKVLEDIECERSTNHEDMDDEYQKLLLQSINGEEPTSLEQEKGKKAEDESNNVNSEENHIIDLISLTKSKFISTSLSTCLIPAPGSAAMLYDHWSKSPEDVIKEYKKLNYIEEEQGNSQIEYEDKWVNDEDEDEIYYISDSGDEEEDKYYKHPSNWNYYTRVKKMIQKIESEEGQQEISKKELEKEKGKRKGKEKEKRKEKGKGKEKEKENTFSSSILDIDLNSDPHLLSTSSFFGLQDYSSKYMDSSEGIQLLSSPQNPPTNVLSPVTGEKEDGYDSLDEEIKNINIDDILKNVLNYSQREEEKSVKSSRRDESAKAKEKAKEKEKDENIIMKESQGLKESQSTKESQGSKEKKSVKQEHPSSPFSSPLIGPLESYPSTISLFNQSQEYSQESFQFSQPMFNSLPILPSKTERIQEINSSSSSTQPKVGDVKEEKEGKEEEEDQYISASLPPPSLFHSGMKRLLKQTTLSSMTTNEGKLLTIKRELPTVPPKKKRRKYGF